MPAYRDEICSTKLDMTKFTPCGSTKVTEEHRKTPPHVVRLVTAPFWPL